MDEDIGNLVEPLLVVEPSLPADAVVSRLREVKLKFVLVSGADVPPRLLGEDQLLLLAGEKDQPVGALSSAVPPALILEDEPLAGADVREILTILGQTSAVGCVVFREDEPVGIISRSTLARALAVDDLPLVSFERGVAFGGSMTPPRTFICRTCGLRRRPRLGDKVPRCAIWDHGPMEPDK